MYIKGACNDETSPGLAFDFAPELRRCPWSQLDPETMDIVSWFSDHRDFGLLPYGSERIDDEPAFVLEAFRLIKSEIAKAESRQRARQVEEMERARRRSSHGRAK